MADIEALPVRPGAARARYRDRPVGAAVLADVSHEVVDGAAVEQAQPARGDSANAQVAVDVPREGVGNRIMDIVDDDILRPRGRTRQRQRHGGGAALAARPGVLRDGHPRAQGLVPDAAIGGVHASIDLFRNAR